MFRRSLVTLCLSLFGVAPPALAGVALSALPNLPGTLAVGQTGIPASLSITNQSTPPDSTTNITLTAITFVPSCGTASITSADCPAPSIDPGVLQPSPTGVGQAGSACAGVTFTNSIIDAAQGKYQFTPSLSVVLGPTGGASASCVISFTVNVLKRPTKDSDPASGTQTAQVGFASGMSTIGSSGSGHSQSQVTIVPASSSVATTASAAIALGGTISDSAVLSGGASPTGTITFTLFGPNNTSCSGGPVFTSTVLVSGNGTYASGNFTPTSAGTYRWIANYSGDTNNAATTNACNGANENVAVSLAAPTVVTTASAGVLLGAPISDSAVLSSGSNPTGTITFVLFGPDNATCAGGPVFTSTVPVAGNGTYGSGIFTPTLAGTYRWIANYSGDANNSTVANACNAANESVLVGPASPPAFVSAASRKVHGVAGTFDLPLSAVATNPTTEPRSGPAQTIVFTFDKVITAATVAVTEGVAIAGGLTFSGDDVIVSLSGVNNQQYVTIVLTNVASSDGSTGGSGSARIGFLLGDVNQNRVVTVADLGLVNAQLAQPVTAANYLKDVNASGTLSVADKGITNANLTTALPAP